MERITMRLDERVERWAREEAAKRGMSLSRFVEQLLEEKLKHEATAQRLKRQLAR